MLLGPLPSQSLGLGYLIMIQYFLSNDVTHCNRILPGLTLRFRGG